MVTWPKLVCTALAPMQLIRHSTSAMHSQNLALLFLVDDGFTDNSSFWLCQKNCFGTTAGAGRKKGRKGGLPLRPHTSPELILRLYATTVHSFVSIALTKYVEMTNS